jgi:hypothetical protein
LATAGLGTPFFNVSRSDADDLAIVVAGFETVGTKKGFCLATEA